MLPPLEILHSAETGGWWWNIKELRLWDDYQNILGKHAETLWTLVHTDYVCVFVCLCPSPVWQRIRLGVLAAVHHQEEWLSSRQQQTLDRLRLSAYWEQGNNNEMTKSCWYSCSWQISTQKWKNVLYMAAASMWHLNIWSRVYCLQLEAVNNVNMWIIQSCWLLPIIIITSSILLFLQKPFPCNATVYMTETETDTKQVDCLLGE